MREVAEFPGAEYEPQNQTQTPILAPPLPTMCPWLLTRGLVTPSAWAASLVTIVPARGWSEGSSESIHTKGLEQRLTCGR